MILSLHLGVTFKTLDQIPRHNKSTAPTCHSSVIALDLQLPVVVAQQVPDLFVVDLDVGDMDLVIIDHGAGHHVVVVVII